MELTQYYRPKGCETKYVVLKLGKSLHGQTDSPKLFYQHLCHGMAKLDFEPSASDSLHPQAQANHGAQLL